jgi:hypothetical protein
LPPSATRASRATEGPSNAGCGRCRRAS